MDTGTGAGPPCSEWNSAKAHEMLEIGGAHGIWRGTTENSHPADRRTQGVTMPELRQNYFTKEWVIIATERAKRPEDLATHRPFKVVPPFVETCPFCAGNENKTPPEVMRVPANGSG